MFVFIPFSPGCFQWPERLAAGRLEAVGHGGWGGGCPDSSRKGREAWVFLGGVCTSRRKGLSEAGRDSGNRKELK